MYLKSPTIASLITFIFFFGLNLSCQPRIKPPEQPTSHNLMVAKLDSIVHDAKENPFKYFNANRFRIDSLETVFHENPDNTEMAFYIALEYQNSKLVEKSIPIIEQIRKKKLDPFFRQTVYETLAVSYLRLAEISNCIENYSPSSCTLPFDESAVHLNKTYIQSTINLFEALLKLHPNNHTWRWMYNIAHIANGSYKDRINSKFLIEGLQKLEKLPDNLTSPKFVNVGKKAGVGDNQISGGVCVEDFNNDSYLDIITTSYGLDHQVRYYVSDGKGHFLDKTREAGLEGIVSGLNIVCGDINNSGYQDLFILRGAWLAGNGRHPNSLLRNNGNNTFTDITLKAGLTEEAPTQTAAFADINNDGNLDIFVGNESKSPWQVVFTGDEAPAARFPSSLYLNNGNETFTKAKIASLSVDAFVKGAVWGDINNDGWPDLYLSIMGENNKLFVHRGLDEDGLPQFEEIAKSAGVELPRFSFPVWFWDYDNNGLMDILVLTYDIRHIDRVAEEVAKEASGLKTRSEYPRLYKNMGNESFKDVTKEANLNKVMFAMGANFGDINNDGYPDFYVGTGAPDLKSIVPNRLFLNGGNGRFYESTAFSKVGHLQKGHGVSFADLIGNGSLDIYAVLGGAFEGDYYPNALFKNLLIPDNYLFLTLEGTTSNRQGIGARIKAVFRDSSSYRNLYRTVSTGGSFGSNTSRVHFSFGPTTTNIDSIIIHWPGNKKSQILTNIRTNQHLIIKEDKRLPYTHSY